MTQSPGHRKWPDHEVRETHLDQRVRVALDGESIADSTDVIKVEEDDHPPRYYFPRGDVRMDKLDTSATTSECPFKGKARHFNLKVGEKRVDDAVWSYENPYDEHAALKDRLAFYDEKIGALEISPRP